ncbi:FUSC family protein [Streptomyces sp. NPDC050560]|uniref:FUSC family protein n=1 Tax=Streptomyces sp. NPDC050560 TaxID=3365630 RepID=UPI00378F70A6
MSWSRALVETGRSGLSVERTRLQPLVALRAAVGLALVVAFTDLWFGPAVAAGSAFGAFQAAIATFQPSWRPRPELALASGTSLAVSTFVGYLTVDRPPLFLLLLFVWALAAGLCWAAGPTTGFIASSNVAMMVVTVTLPTSVAGAAGHAASMVAGGVVQAGLVMLLPVRRWGAHRDALADALAAEADYARRLRHEPLAAFDPAPLMQARSAAALTPRQARGRPAELHGSRGLAERIRPVLALLADPAVGAAAEGQERDRARELLNSAAAILDAAARAIRRAEPVRLPPNAVAAFKTPDTGAILSGPARRAALRLGLLLHDVVESAGGTRGPSGLPRPPRQRGGGPGRPARPRSRPGLLALPRAAVRGIRGRAGPGSPVRRHAVRVSVVAAVGYVLGAALPLGHGYWAPLAAVMVMRPDFTQTYSRAVARLGGTLVGVVLATVVVRLASPGEATAAALAVLSAGMMYLLLRTGQFAVQACIAAYVVFLLGMGGEEWTQTVPERVLLTLLGGVLAMVAYALYPDWETPRLRAGLADWLRTNGRYAAAVLARYAGSGDEQAVRDALLLTRDARIAWREALQRAAGEPVRGRGLSVAAADAANRAMGEFGRAAMLLEAHLPEHERTAPDASHARAGAPLPGTADLADTLRAATDAGAEAVRERREPDWTELRAALRAWEARLMAGEEAPGGAAGPVRAAGPGGGAPSEEPDAARPPLHAHDTRRLVRDAAALLLRGLDDLSAALAASAGSRASALDDPDDPVG